MKRFYIEIANACNLKCTFCTLPKGNNYMNIDDFDNYTSQVRAYGEYLYLHVLGEPLLHPDFLEILSILDKKQFKVQLVTNGTLLNEKLNLQAHPSIRKIAISIHSINNQSVNDNYFINLNNFLNNHQNINIELRFYDFNNLENRIKKYHQELLTKYQIIETTKKGSYKLKEHLYIQYSDLFKWPNINDSFHTQNGYCHGLIDQLAILNDGTVTSCCLDGQGINKLGNLKNESLSEILNSNLYLESVKAMHDNKLILKLCQHCHYHDRFDKHN